MNKNLSNQKVLQIFGQIAQTLQKKKLLTSQEKIVLTISGGQDSVCLLIIFFLLRRQLLLNFDLLFCHHFWQKSSFFTMLHVAKCNFCCSSKIMFFFPLHRLISEKAARDWRHKVIQRTTLFYRYTTATQAHTKSDRIESILFNLIRRTGLTGVVTLQFQHIQSLFLYNKFYPVTLLLPDSHFSDSLKSAEYKNPNPTKGSDYTFQMLYKPSGNLLTVALQQPSKLSDTLPCKATGFDDPERGHPKPAECNFLYSGGLDILHRKKFGLCETRKIEMNDMFFQTLVRPTFYKVTKKYAFTETKNINYLLQLLDSLNSSLYSNFLQSKRYQSELLFDDPKKLGKEFYSEQVNTNSCLRVLKNVKPLQNGFEPPGGASSKTAEFKDHDNVKIVKTLNFQLAASLSDTPDPTMALIPPNGFTNVKSDPLDTPEGGQGSGVIMQIDRCLQASQTPLIPPKGVSRGLDFAFRNAFLKEKCAGQSQLAKAFNTKYIYDCLSIYISPLFYTPLYTFVTISEFDFFIAISNKRIVKLLTQLTILSFASQKVPFGYPLPSTRIPFDIHRILEDEKKGKQQKFKKRVSATKSKTANCYSVTLKLIGKSNYYAKHNNNPVALQGKVSGNLDGCFKASEQSSQSCWPSESKDPVVLQTTVNKLQQIATSCNKLQYIANTNISNKCVTKISDPTRGSSMPKGIDQFASRNASLKEKSAGFSLQAFAKQNNAELRTYKTYYNQLKRLGDLRVIALFP